jgi:predicted anti-sigma-YlaC factor YlaD
MWRIVILCIHDPKAEMPDKEFIIDHEYEYSSQAELRGLRWLLYRPNDIVMLEPV